MQCVKHCVQHIAVQSGQTSKHYSSQVNITIAENDLIHILIQMLLGNDQAKPVKLKRRECERH